MNVIDAVVMIKSIAPKFDALTDWEKDFILTQATSLMGGTVDHLTTAQGRCLRAIYAKVILTNALPKDLLAASGRGFRLNKEPMP